MKNKALRKGELLTRGGVGVGRQMSGVPGRSKASTAGSMSQESFK